MVTTSAICGLPIPELSDQIDISATGAIGGLALAADSMMVPRFSSTSARDTAIPSPEYGQMCYVSGTGELYVYKKQRDAWCSAVSRVRRVTSSVTNTSTSTYADVNDLDISVEGNSTYYGRLNMALRGNTAGDMKLRMRGPAGAVIRATHVRMIAPSGTAYTHTQVDAVTAWESTDIIIGLLDPSTVYWTANFQLWISTTNSGTIDTSFAKNAASTNASEVSEDSILELWKVG